MSGADAIQPSGRVLTPGNTVAMGRTGHRLALGVQWRDAASQAPIALPAPADAVTDLEAVGRRPCHVRLDAHGGGRHALRHAGAVASLLAHALLHPEPVDDGNPANDAEARLLTLRVFGRRRPMLGGHEPGNDPRVFVPRRLAFMPVLEAGVPPASVQNIREAWLWPGAAYPVASGATAVRGCIQREISPGRRVAVPWARVVLTRPGPGAPDFMAEAPVAHAHGDDRGEFLMLIGAAAMAGGVALPARLNLRAWVFLPPAATPFDPARPLESLPIENAGTVMGLDEVLRGHAVPTGYLQAPPRALEVELGRAQTMKQEDLVFS